MPANSPTPMVGAPGRPDPFRNAAAEQLHSRHPAPAPPARRPASGAAAHRDQVKQVARTGTDMVRAASGRDLKHHQEKLPVVVAVAHRGHKHRRVLAPLYSGAGLAAVGAVLHWAAPGGLVPELVLAPLPVVWGAGRRGLLALKARRSKEQASALTRWEWAGWPLRVGAGLWMPMVSGAGWTLGVRDALLGGLVAGGAGWWTRMWRLRREEKRDEQVAELEAAPVDEVEPESSPVEVTWSDVIASPTGPLPGSYLVGLSEDEKGWTATVQLVRGRQSRSDVSAAVRRIASAYAVDEALVIVDMVPGRKADKARIAVYEEPPFLEGYAWEGPELFDAESGTAPICVYDDGSFGQYRWWAKPGSGASGVVHSLIIGATGSGKSRVIGLLLAYERATPLIVSWVGDPQRGQSLPAWQNDAVDWYAKSDEEIAIMMYVVRAIMYDRSEYLAGVEWIDEKGRTRYGQETFVPTPEMPILSVTLDEGHRITKMPGLVIDLGDEGKVQLPSMAEVLDEIGRMGRKCGIKLRIGTHRPVLEDLESQSLKSALASGNVIVLRVGDRVAGRIIDTVELPINPADIPKEVELPDGRVVPMGGLGFSIGGVGRPALMRTFNTGDELDWALAGELIGLDERAAAVARAWAGEVFERRREWKRPKPSLLACPRVELTPIGGGEFEDAPPAIAAPARPGGDAVVVPLVRNEQPAMDIRKSAVRIVRSANKPLATPEIARRLRLLPGADPELTDNTVVAALRRAEAGCEVQRFESPTQRASLWGRPERELVNA